MTSLILLLKRKIPRLSIHVSLERLSPELPTQSTVGRPPARPFSERTLHLVPLAHGFKLGLIFLPPPHGIPIQAQFHSLQTRGYLAPRDFPVVRQIVNALEPRPWPPYVGFPIRRVVSQA